MVTPETRSDAEKLEQSEDKESFNKSSVFLALTAITGLVGSIGSLLPGYTYFKSISPPLFEELGLLTAGIAVVVLVMTFYRARKTSSAVRWIITAVAVLVCYTAGLKYLTATAPAPREGRAQIGWYKSDWSLTDKGMEMKAQYPDEPVIKWMMMVGWNDAPEVLWTPASVLISGGLLVLLFFSGFVMWATGWALAAKHMWQREQTTKRLRNAPKRKRAE